MGIPPDMITRFLCPGISFKLSITKLAVDKVESPRKSRIVSSLELERSDVPRSAASAAGVNDGSPEVLPPTGAGTPLNLGRSGLPKLDRTFVLGVIKLIARLRSC